MKKRITFTILGLLLMVGGVMAQSVTTLYLDGGNNLSFSDQVYTDSHVTGAIVTFSGNGFNGTYSAGLSGSNWVAEYHEGETHSFTINLNEGAPAGFHFYIAAKYYDNFNSGGVYKDVTITDGATSFTVDINSSDCPALLEASNGDDGKGTYQYVWIINKDGSSGAKLNIASITRTITTASSVDKPTITAPSTYDGESTAVTITPGANNHHVKYSVSGSSSDVSNVQITSETTIYITGSNDVTITAVGYNEEESDSNTDTKTITYSNVIPSGISSVWTGNQSFGGNWSESISIDKSNFSDIEEGDYVYLYATHDGDVTDIGFRSDRNGWDEAPWYGFTNANGYTSGGNGAHGSMAVDETYWWLKVGKENGTIKANVYEGDHDTDIDLDAPYYFKNYNTIIQGLNFTLTGVEIHKAKSISENSDNSISKYTDMIVNLERSFVKDMWNTVCLPFAPTAEQANALFGADYQLAAFTGVSGTTMEFTTIAISGFEAGKPYLVKPTQDLNSAVTLFDVDLTATNGKTVTFGDYSFKGTFVSKSFDASERSSVRFVGSGNKLLTPNDDSSMKALRCYFVVPAKSAARSFTIYGMDDSTTSISGMSEATTTNYIYDLSGRQVVNPVKGLYIVNGRKVVIK